MPGKSDLDLEFAEFAEKRTAKMIRCATCKLDEPTRTWIDQKMLEGVPFRWLELFLATKNIKVSASALQNHKAHAIAR